MSENSLDSIKIPLIAISLIMISIIASFALISLTESSSYSGTEVVEISIEARQFSYNVSSFTVTRGVLVRLLLTSVDVVHGFGITEYNINVKIPVGSVTKVEFIASKVGSFEYFCTVFCGTGHANHRGIMYVVQNMTEMM